MSASKSTTTSRTILPASAAVAMGNAEDDDEVPMADAVPVIRDEEAPPKTKNLREEPEAPQVQALRAQNRRLYARVLALSLVLLAVVVGLIVVLVVVLVGNDDADQDGYFDPPAVFIPSETADPEATMVGTFPSEPGAMAGTLSPEPEWVELNANQGYTQQTYLADKDLFQVPEAMVITRATIWFSLEFQFSEDSSEEMLPTGPTVEELEGVVAQTKDFLQDYFIDQYGAFVALDISDAFAFYSPYYSYTNAANIYGKAEVLFEGDKLPERNQAELVRFLNQYLAVMDVLEDFLQTYVWSSPPEGSIFAETRSVFFTASSGSGIVPTPFPTTSAPTKRG